MQKNSNTTTQHTPGPKLTAKQIAQDVLLHVRNTHTTEKKMKNFQETLSTEFTDNDLEIALEARKQYVLQTLGGNVTKTTIRSTHKEIEMIKAEMLYRIDADLTEATND